MQPFAAQNLRQIIHMPAEFPEGATNQTVGFFAVHHDRADGCGVGAHDRPGQIRRDALAGHQAMICFPVVAVARVVFGVHQIDMVPQLKREAGALNTRFNHFGASDQNGTFCGFFQHGLCGTQHTLVFAFGENDAARFCAGSFKNGPHQQG